MRWRVAPRRMYDGRLWWIVQRDKGPGYEMGYAMYLTAGRAVEEAQMLSRKTIRRPYHYPIDSVALPKHPRYLEH